MKFLVETTKFIQQYSKAKKFDYYADEYLITLSNFKSYPNKYPWDFSPREIDINFVFWARLH